MGIFGRSEPKPSEAELVGKMCRIWGTRGVDKSDARIAVVEVFDASQGGYSWGSRNVWFPHAEPLTDYEMGVGKEQDSGKALEGVYCYVWDANLFSKTRIKRVEEFDRDYTFPYKADGIWMHARPVALGPLPEPEKRVASGTDIPIQFPGAPSERKPKKEAAPVAPEPTLTWDDVKGQDEAKRALRDAVEYPVKFSALYTAYKKKPSKGVLLYGPPGCGKTLLGRVLAQSIGSADGFRYIKGSEIFSRYVGAEQEAIAEHFQQARKYKKRTGNPMILFYDEADAIFLDREAGNNDGGHQSRQQAITRFLAEVDGVDPSGAFVILATNRPYALDAAVVREGRIDRRIRVDRPNRDVCAEILGKGFNGVPCADGVDPTQIALAGIFDPRKVYASIDTDDRGTIHVRFHHAVSGAVIDGIVDRTISTALQRDIDAGNTQPSGITAEDVTSAVEALWRSTWDMDNRAIYDEATGGIKPTAIRVFHGKQCGVAGGKQELVVKHEIPTPPSEADDLGLGGDAE